MREPLNTDPRYVEKAQARAPGLEGWTRETGTQGPAWKDQQQVHETCVPSCVRPRHQPLSLRGHLHERCSQTQEPQTRLFSLQRRHLPWYCAVCSETETGWSPEPPYSTPVLLTPQGVQGPPHIPRPFSKRPGGAGGAKLYKCPASMILIPVAPGPLTEEHYTSKPLQKTTT